jgi:hypothetical protein
MVTAMRNDYFTFVELEYVLGIYGRKLHALAKEEGLPMISFPNIYIIPKKRFFEWFDAQKAAGKHRRYRVDRVEKERDVWADKKIAMRYGDKYND